MSALKHHATLTSFLLLILLFSILLPETFLTGRNLFNISQQMSMLMVTASAMTIVMAMGDYDLSVGSMASLVGIVAACGFLVGRCHVVHQTDDDENGHHERGNAGPHELLGALDGTCVGFVCLIVAVVAHDILLVDGFVWNRSLTGINRSL